MVKRWIALLVLLVSVVVPLARAEMPLGPAEYTSVDELALVIAGYFPKLRGEVTAVQNGTVTISLGRKDGIVPNMVLSLWREGKDILHPLTKAVIGRSEDEVGAIEVTNAAESSSTAVMKRQVLVPRPGDRARMSPRKINIAVVPLRSDRPEIIEGLVERLGELGRFTVLEPPKVTAFLQERKQRDATLVREMGAAFALDAVVTVAILPTEDKQLVTARIFYSDETQPLDTIVATLNLTTKREALGDIRPFFAPAKEVKVAGSRTPALPRPARYFTIADVDGDGAQEFVFSDAQVVSVYRLAETGWTEVWTETLPAGETKQQQIRIDAADVNGNGKAEIFVARMLRGVATSYVLELREGSFLRIAELPGFLRVVKVPGRAAALVGQEYDPENLFAGAPKEYRWSEGTYAVSAVLAVAKGVNLFGFAIADLGEERPLLAAYDKDDRVVVYATDTPLWKSEEEYLAVTTQVIRPLTGLDAVLGRDATALDRSFGTSAEQSERLRAVRIPGRIVAADIAGKGIDDIIAAKNEARTFLGGTSNGEVHGLSWTGVRLNPRWSIKELPGAVLDVGAAPAGSGRYAAYALVKEDRGLFRKTEYWLEKFEEK